MTELMKKITKQDIRNTLAVVIVALTFIFLFKLLTKAIPAENQNSVNTLGGLVFGAFGLVVSYFFGQSKSEVDQQKKDNENNQS
jgi:hypothetical protein